MQQQEKRLSVTFAHHIERAVKSGDFLYRDAYLINKNINLFYEKILAELLKKKLYNEGNALILKISKIIQKAENAIMMAQYHLMLAHYYCCLHNKTEGYKHFLKFKKTNVSLLKLEHYFGVSRRALLVRLNALKLISNDMYNHLAEIPVIRSAKEYGYDTSIYLPGNKDLVIGDYGVKARNLFEQGLISEGHYIELLLKIGVDPTQNNE